MTLMAFADGELADDDAASAEVEALLERSAEARTMVNDLRLAQRALHNDLLGAEDGTKEIPALDDLRERVLADVTALQLMAHLDGELVGVAAEEAGIEALLAQSAGARTLVHDLQLSGVALRREVLSDQTEQDLSMVRGRIMTRLPAEARPAVAADKASEGFVERLRALLFGRAGLAIGLAAAAALMVLALGQMKDQLPADDNAGPIVAEQIYTMPADGEPAVIIEEMEIDSGTVLVDNGDEPGAATIIWHYQSDDDEEQDDDGEGAG